MLNHDRLHLFEEHSSTLPIWWENDAAGRTVVYLDAHLDLQKTSAESLAALKACTTVEQVRNLEAPGNLNPSPRYAYGIENFLYAAHEIGLIERLIWVAPPHVPRRYSTALIDYVQQMDGIEFDELIGFRNLGGNRMRGRLLGLDITICDYEELGQLDIKTDYYLDIDTDYFIKVPGDRMWVDPSTVIERIITQLGKPALTTISRAVTSGFTPLAFRFIGDYLYSQLGGCRNEFEYYQKLSAAILELETGEIESGMQSCEALIRHKPDLAAAYYILSLCATDLSQRRDLLMQSCERDINYRFDLCREAISILHRKKPYDPSVVKQLLSNLESLQMEPLQRQLGELALALVLAVEGNSESAKKLLAGQSGEYADHPDVLLSICASQLDDSERRTETRDMLHKVKTCEKNASIVNLYLGDLEFTEQNYDAAIDYYNIVHQRAPAWMLPLERMLQSYEKLDLHDEANVINETIRQRQHQLDKVLAQPS